MNAEKPKAVVCVSGGMDSCVAAAIAVKDTEPFFLHVDYGQKTREKEALCFQKIAGYYHLPPECLLEVDLPYLGKIGGSALTDSRIEVPRFSKPEEGKEVPVTYVPFRNTHILSIAVSWAEVLGAGRIYIGAVAEDSAGYPDCRPEYYEAFNQLITVGSPKGEGLKVVTPIIGMSKTEIVKLGLSLEAPFEFTWSCYERADKACGTCDSCLRRLRAFKQAGARDPVPYI